jgi:hypothetical protein
LLKVCVAFLGLRKRVILHEPQNHTRIILRLVTIFRFVVEIVERKHYQQKEDSYIGEDCVFSSVSPHSFIQQNFERNMIQSPHKYDTVPS